MLCMLGVDSLTFDLSPHSLLSKHTNSTGRHICCNGSQIAVIVAVGLIIIALTVGFGIYNCPQIRSRRFRGGYNEIY